MNEPSEQADNVQTIAAKAGLQLSEERAAVVAAAAEAFRPLLASLAEIDLADAVPAPVFDAEW